MGRLVTVGDRAPEFSLSGFPERTYRLSDFLGEVLVLAFYPADNSPVCTLQMKSYSEGAGKFVNLGSTVLGISPQGIDSHRTFAERLGVDFPLLCDLDKQVATSYGVLGPLGFYRRSIFVINPSGIITYAHRAAAGLTFKLVSTLVAEIAKAK